ncbi:MAG: DUF934 domain-containing protein [Alphaproteobacteria bacterium]
MPLLDRSGWGEDPFARIETADIEGLGHVLVPWPHLDEALSRRGGNQQLGVEIDNALRFDALKPALDRVALVSVVFPGFADGRGFSLARLMRMDGFAGTLRATGPLIADQLAEAFACGFDQVEIPPAVAERQPLAHWQAALASISIGYQRGYGQSASILDQRRAARLRELPNVG